MGHLLRALLAVALAAAPAAGEHPEHGDHEHAALEWTVHTPMPSLHSDAPAVATPAGTVLIAGGCGGTQLSCDDPDMWADCTYCSHVTAEVLEYDPSADSWQTLPDAPHPRYRHAAALTPDGELVLLGGRDVDDNIVTAVDVYDLEAKTWRTLTSAWGDATSDLDAFTAGATVFAAGGYTPFYDAALGTVAGFEVAKGADDWTAAAVAPSPMLHARGDLTVASDGKTAYVVGGWHHSNWCDAMAAVEKYDAATNVWTVQPPLKVARADAAVGLAADGTLYVVGGETKPDCDVGSVPVDDVETLALDGAAFEAIGAIPEEKYRVTAAVVGTQMYVFGGQGERSFEFCGGHDFCYHTTDHVWALRVTDDADADADGALGGGAMAAIGVAVIVAVAGAAALYKWWPKPAAGAQALGDDGDGDLAMTSVDVKLGSR